MTAPAEIPTERVILACPRCGARDDITDTRYLVGALCHSGHAPEMMRVVDDCDSSEHDEQQAS